MPEIMRSMGNHNEALALLLGVVEIVIAVLFILHKTGVFMLSFIDNWPDFDLHMLYFFAALTLLSGIIHLLTTLGFIGTK